MNEFWKKVEHINAKTIPYAIVGLLVVIVLELFFHDFAEKYHTYVLILDYLIIGIFVIDLTFLAIKAKTVKFFFKSYWLDLLAVIPLALGITVIGKLYRAASATGKVALGQSILHESLEARKGISAIGRSTSRVAKYIRMGARSIRIVTKSRLFTQFHEKHHAARHGIKHKKYLRNPPKIVKKKTSKAKKTRKKTSKTKKSK